MKKSLFIFGDMRIFKKKEKEVFYFAVVKSKNRMQHYSAVFRTDFELSKTHFFEWLVEVQEESEKEFGEEVLIVNCKRI